MSQRVYVDTNIFLDFLLDRDSYAFDFFMRALSCEFTIVISEVVLFELSRHGASFDSFSSLLRHKLVLEKITDADRISARTMPTHFADGLHAAVALRMNVDMFLSADKGFSFLAIHRTPDEI